MPIVIASGVPPLIIPSAPVRLRQRRKRHQAIRAPRAPSFTVTGSQSGSTSPGMMIRVKVLTGASQGTQNGATATQAGAAAHQAAITPTQIGSVIYGSGFDVGSTALTAASGCTAIDSSHLTDGITHGSVKTSAATSALTSETVGFSAPADAGLLALAEILANGTITEDASSPAVATTTAGLTVTAPAFSPPYSSVLVVMLSTNGGASVVTPAVSDTSGLGLIWHQRVLINPTGGGSASVWYALMPAGTQTASAALTAPGTLSAAAAVTERASAALVASSLLTAAAKVTEQASAHLTASSSLSAAALITRKATGALSAPGILTVPGIVTRPGAAHLAASPSLLAAGSLAQAGQAHLAAAPVLSASGSKMAVGTAALAAGAMLTVTAIAPDLSPLWDAYLAATEVLATATATWRMMRQAGGTDGTAGFLYQKVYEADRAADAAYSAWLAANARAFPGASG